MATTRTHVVMSSELLREIDLMVGKRGRSAFLSDIARQEIERRGLVKFLDRKQPAWSRADHPELKRGAAAWVSKMRRAEEKERSAKRP